MPVWEVDVTDGSFTHCTIPALFRVLNVTDINPFKIQFFSQVQKCLRLTGALSHSNHKSSFLLILETNAI